MTAELDEGAFAVLAERTLAHCAEAVEEQAPDFEVDFESGILTIETADGAIFLLNRHAPLRQLWLSSPQSGAGHFAHDAAEGDRKSTRGGDSLQPLLERELSGAAGQTIVLDPWPVTQ
jgi:frataxin